MKVKLNKNIAPYKAGREINIACDEHNIPLEKFWRDRLKDSEIDNCLTVISEEKVNTKSKKEA
jgi:hypothetical protein